MLLKIAKSYEYRKKGSRGYSQYEQYYEHCSRIYVERKKKIPEGVSC